MNRRSFLTSSALLGAATLPGCAYVDSPQTGGLRLLADPITVLTDDQLRADQQELIQSAVNGTATAYGYEPFETEAETVYAALNGTYYEISDRLTGTSEAAEKPVLRIEPTTNASDAVPLERYSEAAVAVISSTANPDEWRSRPLHPTTKGYDELYPSPRYPTVTWDNQTYTLSVAPDTVMAWKAEVRINSVADDETAFNAYVLDELVDVRLTPDQLTADERAIIQQAREEEYVEERPYSDAFQTVFDAVRTGDAETYDNWKQAYLISYDGTLYRAVTWESESD